MTKTAPWRRMILHFSHIGLTDGRTFMVPFNKRRCGRSRKVWARAHEQAARGERSAKY